MKCPYCKIEMVHGYLNCGQIIWSERKHKLVTWPDNTEQYALHLEKPSLPMHYVESDCCPKCKRIIIDASGYESNIGKYFVD